MIESSSKEDISFKIIDSERQAFTIIFSIIENKLQILINENSTLSISYKAELEVKNFQEINKFFLQFDTIEEICDFIKSLDNPEEKIKIKKEKNFTDLVIILPKISKSKENNIKLKIPQIELKESELIVKLCQQVSKIDLLESKVNFLFHCCGKTEKDFYLYEDILSNFRNMQIDSEIAKIEDLYLVSNGIREKLNKSIKEIKLLYRASRDGDSGNNFHSMCDGKENTVTFIKSKNGKRFGGFASEAWNSNNSWSNDKNSFLFSLDNQEYYYSINTNNINNNNRLFGSNYNICGIFGSKQFGPTWGGNNSYDLMINNKCLNNDSSQTNQNVYNYKGKSYALSGANNFQVEDYETYELILV